MFFAPTVQLQGVRVWATTIPFVVSHLCQEEKSDHHLAERGKDPDDGHIYGNKRFSPWGPPPALRHSAHARDWDWRALPNPLQHGSEGLA